ncbi:MAG: insulinase family protein [Solobacterium sp.]|nr:insulinase family protein [Solobacterium sp.]
MRFVQGNTIHGFTLTRVSHVDDCDADLYEFKHNQTGAEVCWLDRADTNKTFAIAFKTLPQDDTGVFHILEHSVLNGSKKYPLQEPFVELLKGSLQTFLNAFTYPDKTVYPVASRHDKDFMNLISVYMDAVFCPAIYDNPNIFYQEGWHYEIRDPEEEAVYKGVVLNEMKGAFSSVDEILVDTFNRVLFPDNCYKYVSGGDPAFITDLSYEQALATHRKYYHPSNARVFLDGTMAVEDVLKFMDEEYFSKYEKEDLSFVIPMQKEVKAQKCVCEYEIDANESEKDKTQIAMGRIVSTFDNYEKNIAWSALASILVSSNESPLKKVILDKGLGQDVELELFDGIQQPWVILNVRNTNEEHYDEVVQTILETARKLVSEGLPHEQITASLNQMEFRYKEKREPAGLMYAQRSFDAWLYDGDPLTYLCLDNIFEELRQKTETGYFEELLREFLLDEEHLCTVVAVPSGKLAEARLNAEREKLQAARENWSDVQKYIDLNLKLDAWQEAGDSPEVLATLPKLTLDDLNDMPEDDPFEEKKIRGVPVILHPAEKSGIVYLNLYFNLAGVQREFLPALGLYAGMFMSLPTKQKTVEQLQEAVRRDLGGLNVFLDAFSMKQDNKAVLPLLGVSCSVLEKNLDKAIDLILEVLQETVFDKERILPLLKQNNEDFRQGLIMNGHAMAMRRASAHFSAEGVFREYVGGISSGLHDRDLEAHYDERIDAFINECEMYSDVLFASDRLTISITGEHEELLENMIERLHRYDANRALVHYPLLKEPKEAIVIPAGISYSAIAGNLIDHGGEFSAGMHVISQALTYDYLWSEVRVKGGAYGTGFSVNPNGNCGAYSYRDPDPLATLETFASIPEYIRTFGESQDITQLIIGTIAATEPLLSPAARIRLSDARYFRHVSYEDRLASRQQIIQMNVDTFRSYADLFEQIEKDTAVCVIGARETIAELPEDFTEIRIDDQGE